MASIQPSTTSRRNYLIMIIEGSLFWMASAFIEPTTVVSVFINEYTGSMQLVGLANSLMQAAGILGIFIMGMHIHKISDHGKIFSKFAVLFRSPFLLLIPFFLLDVKGTPMVLLFILMQTIFFFANGFITLSWQNINANTIAARDRGPMQGYQQFFSAIIGVLSAVIIKYLMVSDLPPNLRYATIFGCCAVLFIVNSLVLRNLKDAPHEHAAAAPRSFSRYIANFYTMWKGNPVFRHIMYGRLLFNGGMMATSLLVLFGRNDGGLTLAKTSSLIFVQVLGQMVGGLFWGNINRHFGNPATMVLSHIPTLMVALIGLTVIFFVPGVVSFWWIAAMVFFASLQALSFIGYSNSLFERMPRQDLSAYLVLQFLILLPFTALPYLAGMIAQHISFLAVFALILAFGVAGLLYTLHYARGYRRAQIAPPA